MNFYDKLDWQTMLSAYPADRIFDVSEYHRILSPDFPDFLHEYAAVPSLRRLNGVGLLCGTDWTPLFKNRFFYSRLEHSIGVALIVWHFTHDKIQSLAGLFHDSATPAFSHVADFRAGDALTQTASEAGTEQVILRDRVLRGLLERDGISVEKICNYHIYPVADNECPQLSADRLEYMFPSGASFLGSWTCAEVREIYADIRILKNESGVDELGFSSVDAAEEYCRKFCETAHILQLNENKSALSLLADIVSLAVHEHIISEEDCFLLSEAQIIGRFENVRGHDSFEKLFRTFRAMKTVIHSDELPERRENYYIASQNVKMRYINPLVSADGPDKGRRLSEISRTAAALINDFLSYKDSRYGCVRFLHG